MKVKTNLTEVVLEIKDLSRGGMGVGEKKDSVAEPAANMGDDRGALSRKTPPQTKRPKIYFVPYTAPGDIVRARIVRDEKNYSITELLEVIKPGPVRIQPKCSVFSKCGGCAFQQVPYDLQWKTKVSGVLREFRKVTQNHQSVVVDEFPAVEIYSYRNRVQLRGRLIGGSTAVEIGFFAEQSRNLVPISRCEIAKEELNQFISRYDVKIHQQACGPSHEEFKIELEVDPKTKKVRSSYNQRHGAFGFRQVNDDQNTALQNWIEAQWFGQMANPGNSRMLFDLFGGSGNFSLPMAKYFEHAVIVDVVIPETGTLPAHFMTEKMEVHRYFERLERNENRPKMAKKSHEIRYAIMDPPRSGLKPHGNTILNGLDRLGISHAVLIGCEVDAWVRDVRLFLDHGFHLKRLAVFDFFPQTPHVESVALFEKFST